MVLRRSSYLQYFLVFRKMLTTLNRQQLKRAPGWFFSLSSSSGLPLFLLPLKPPPGPQKPLPGPPPYSLLGPRTIIEGLEVSSLFKGLNPLVSFLTSAGPPGTDGRTDKKSIEKHDFTLF